MRFLPLVGMTPRIGHKRKSVPQESPTPEGRYFMMIYGGRHSERSEEPPKF
jgi:hypothetical protein